MELCAIDGASGRGSGMGGRFQLKVDKGGEGDRFSPCKKKKINKK